MPEVLAVDHECLVLRWVEPAKLTVDGAARSARRSRSRTRPVRRRTADSPAEPTATSPTTASSAGCRCPGKPAPTWAEFYATRRVLPYLKLARDRGQATAEDATADRGACWAGSPSWCPRSRPPACTATCGTATCVWGAEGRGWVIDPAAHGGHRETDLAMLALFGLPHLARVLEAYEQAAPLAEGWESRQGLHQLFPLLVHACMFGGGYAGRAADVGVALRLRRAAERAGRGGVGPRGTAAVAGCSPRGPAASRGGPPTPIPPDGVVRLHDDLCEPGHHARAA